MKKLCQVIGYNDEMNIKTANKQITVSPKQGLGKSCLLMGMIVRYQLGMKMSAKTCPRYL